MLDFSFLDPRLLFPNITETWAAALESVSGVVSFITMVMMIIAEWKLFRKFGEKPWKSFVPYYNTFLVYKHTWSKKAFWIYLISSSLFNAAQGVSKHLSQTNPESMWMTLLLLLSLPVGIVAAVCSILYAFRLAEAFGKGKIFSAGLLLFYSIFISILGFGKSQYVDVRETAQTGDGSEDIELNAEVL